jgi:hypothetical protein
MKVEVSGCNYCGAPLPLVENQFVTECRYCSNKYYVHQDLPPAVILKPQIDKHSARDTVLKELKDKEIAANFIRNSLFERAVLYFIPFFELRGIKAGFSPPAPDKPKEYNYLAYDYLEKASDLADLSLDFFESRIVEDAILTAEQMPFNPVEMRKMGVVIPPGNLMALIKSENPHAREAVENYHRLIYFPVWEISYSFQGIVFKSYTSAVDGQPMKIQALRNHKKKLKMALFGLLALAIFLGRGIHVGGGPLIVTAIFGLPVAAILFPYFWELFAFQEIVEKRGEMVNYQTINYTENSFIKFSRKLVEVFTKRRGTGTDTGKGD